MLSCHSLGTLQQFRSKVQPELTSAGFCDFWTTNCQLTRLNCRKGFLVLVVLLLLLLFPLPHMVTLNLRTLICFLCLFCLIFDEGSYKLTCFVCLALFLLDSDCSHPIPIEMPMYIIIHLYFQQFFWMNSCWCDFPTRRPNGRIPRSSASLGMSENLGLPPQLRMGHLGATDGSESGNPWEGYDNDILYTSVHI